MHSFLARNLLIWPFSSLRRSDSARVASSTPSAIYNMTCQVDISKTKINMEVVMEALGMPPVAPQVTAATMRSLIHSFVDQEYQNKTDLSCRLYSLLPLKPYWFKVDEYGNIVDAWVDIEKVDGQFFYVSHEDAMQVLLAPKKSSGRVTALSVSIETGELRVCHRILKHVLYKAHKILKSRVEVLEAKVADGSAAVPDAFVKEVEAMRETIVELKNSQSSGAAINN